MMRYITTHTRKEFELDITGWLSSIFFPIGQVAKGLSSDKKPSRKPQGTSRHSRTAKKYGWYRSAQGRSLNVYNLDARTREERNEARMALRKSFAEANK